VAQHALAGTPPFARETEAATASAHLDDPLPGSREIPDALYAVLAKAMAKKPSARYSTTADFAEAFAHALDHPEAHAEAEASAPDTSGRLTDEVLRAKFGESRGAFWQRPAEWRLQTRVHRAPKKEGGRLTDTVFRERVEEASRGAVRWRDVKNVKAPPTRVVPVARDASGRLTDDVLQAKIEEEKRRRSKKQ
jgi:hypothetical protein